LALRIKFGTKASAMAAKSKAKKRDVHADDTTGESATAPPSEPATPVASKDAHAAQPAASKKHLVFGVDLDSTEDIEDDSNALVPVAKYAILGMICLMSFAIRLFAVVRYESVRYCSLSPASPCRVHDTDPLYPCR
jgi:hypothetical protein